MDLSSEIVNSFKLAFDAMGMQVLIFSLIIVGASSLSFIVLRLIKIPKSIAGPLSSLATLVVGYFTFINIFT